MAGMMKRSEIFVMSSLLEIRDSSARFGGRLHTVSIGGCSHIQNPVDSQASESTEMSVSINTMRSRPSSRSIRPELKSTRAGTKGKKERNKEVPGQCSGFQSASAAMSTTFFVSLTRAATRLRSSH